MSRKIFSGTPWYRGLPPVASAIEISLQIAVAVAQILGATTLHDQYGGQDGCDSDKTEHYWHTGAGGDDEHATSTCHDDLEDVVERVLQWLAICQDSFSFCSGTA